MTPEVFEKFTRAKGLQPAERITIPEGTILVAEGFKNDNPREFPWGYYETAWAIARKGIDVAQCLTFDAFHDPEYPKDEKKALRVRAAVKEAVKWMGVNVESGRYDI